MSVLINSDFKILVVDDDPDLLQITENLIQKAGFRIRTAKTGQECLSHVIEEKPDLILLDVRLPDMSGVDVCKKIKSDPDQSSTHILMISGIKTASDDVAVGLDAGADGYLLKPLHNREVLANIHSEIRIIKYERALQVSEERHRSILKTSIDGYWFTDLAGHILEVNDAYCEMSGYSQAELLTMKIDDLEANENPEEVARHMQRLIEKGQDRFESKHRRKDGTLFDVELSTQFKTFDEGACVVIIRDITKQKQEFLKVKESELKYRSLIESSTDAIFCVNEKGEYKFTNHLFASTFGKTPEFFEGKTFWDIYDKAHADHRFATTKRVFATGESETIEVDVPLPDKTLYFLATANPIKDDHGRVILVLTHAADITRIKEAEKALQMSEERNRFMMDSLSIGIVAHLPDTSITMANPKASELLGLSESQMKGMEAIDPYWKFVDTNYVPLTLEDYPVNRVLRNQAPLANQILGVIRSELTEIIWLNVNGVPVFNPNGSLKEILISFIDITDLVKAEDILTRTKENFEGYFRMGSTGMCVTSPEKGWIEVNDRLCQMLGYTKDELSGLSWADLTYPEDLKNDLELFDQVVTGKRDSYELEKRFIRKDGSILHTTTSINCLRNKDGSVNHFLASLLDITKRVEAEKALVKAKEKAEESDRLKSAFLANMSHEIRTPMNGILGFAELLKEPDLDGDEKDRYIRMIESGGERLLGIINNLIDISKIESGLMEVSLSKININEKIETLYQFFKPETDQKGIRLVAHKPLSDKEATIITDREKAYAILTNLLKNAIKFTQKGFIEFGYEKKKDFLVFSVRDTGSGIDPDKLEIIFQRFIQYTDSLTRNYEGSGLGLAIAKAYVEMLGGRIWVESEKGTGTTFYFTLPCPA